LGDDSFGQEFHGVFKSNKINTDYVLITDGVPSGLALITVAENGERLLVDICHMSCGPKIIMALLRDRFWDLYCFFYI
jgi:sugar/nucleoside kinase (ribokinase family)